MAKRKNLTGPPCPTGGEEHGGLLDVPMPDGTTLWHCAHSAHYGVRYTDEHGHDVKEFTRHIFTDAEATQSQERYWGKK